MRPSYGVPKFLTKIWDLVEDPRTNDYICWSQDGSSFIVIDEERFAKELLPRYFKHNNMASFVRQLNWYGFHKVLQDETGGLRQDKYCTGKYQHVFFQRGHQELLTMIKRKIPVPRMDDSKAAPDDAHKLLAVLHQLQGRQDAIDTAVEALKRENEALWKEVLQLRQKQYTQQQSFQNASPSRGYDRVETIESNDTLMIDNTGNYNELMPKSEPEDDEEYQNNSQWTVKGKPSRGTKRAFSQEDVENTLEDGSNRVASTSPPQVYETYQQDESDDNSNSSLSESEEINNDDNEEPSHILVQVPGEAEASNRSKMHKKLKSSTERRDAGTEYMLDYSESEDGDEHKTSYITSGHAKRQKNCRSSFFKMEQMLKEMHKENTILTRRVLSLEQRSYEKLSEISTVLSSLASYVMGKERQPKPPNPPLMTEGGKAFSFQLAAKKQPYGMCSKAEAVRPVKKHHES
uniref:HSF-type DNA-binding domain-containing protein n=1 Tax=Leptobrachium leishanense TaxID=445787 RepID=A0A8C5PUS7_9ANUR